ncbi:(Fe-S)-binding protein [Helicobacter sp. MIT 14-3879]|uniref:(Fe-S)-binding protein n=1 Tax=Helicobacter sp. MIT 14-3879 TaxID=2040649 RepID=UPI000E1F33E8|nr:(Fe-S)-binding protein [Helicobacter sp. MIT 14-3879]RDU65226.1 glycerol-3-phosphate dehydrogenase [Helicobacter sp. MIT 14-3879]
MIDLLKLSQSCVKCAKCIPSCTIYQIERDEVNSPRGFIDLLGIYEKNEIALDKNLKNIFETCFLCTTCTTLCPQTIDTASMIIKSRIDIANKFGISWYKRAYFYLLKNRKLMDFVFSFTYFISPCLFKASGDKLRSRIPLSKLGKRTIFPFSKKSFLQKYKKLNKIKHTDSKKVAIFIGCLGNYNYTNIGESLLFILDKLGIEAVIPKQECCGAPAYFTGDIKSVNYLIKKNIEIFESFLDKVDAMIIPEATCAAMILKDWKHALEYTNDTIYLERLEKLLPKIYMATDYLYHHTNLLQALKQKQRSGLKITYHDPCHAKKVLGIYKEPRELLKANYNFVEMKECDRCCGFGGVTIQSQKYHLAYNAGAPKAKNIKDAKADIVSAECSACRMQLNNAMDNENVNTIFKHPLELIKDILKGL